MLGRRAGHPCRFSCPPGRGRSQRNHVEKSLLAGRVRESARIRACRSSGNRTDEGVRPCLAEVACVGTIVFPVRIVWRLLPRRQRMNRIVRGRDGSMPLPESGRFACRKADLSRSRIDSLPDESFPRRYEPDSPGHIFESDAYEELPARYFGDSSERAS